MTEIRTIQASESEAFLELLCRVFRLDATRARAIYYSEPLYDLSRKWALFQDGVMAAVLTTSPLRFGWGRAIGVAGVATDPAYRRRGLASRLLEAVLGRAEEAGEGAAMLFAHDTSLYRRLGFELVDEVVRGPLHCAPPPGPGRSLDTEEALAMYARWASASPSRLVRDGTGVLRWSWSHRQCEALGGGYACIEPGQVREAWFPERLARWPFPPGTEWVGLSGVAASDEVPVRSRARELYVMARGFQDPPQMFMTDQF